MGAVECRRPRGDLPRRHMVGRRVRWCRSRRV